VGHRNAERHLLPVTEIALHDNSHLESIVRRAAAGDEEACVRLVQAHHAPMMRAAFVLTGDAVLAREATQNAWTKAWPRLGKVQRPDQIRSWLVAIAANEARQLVRGGRRRTVYEIAVGMPDQSSGDPACGIEVLDLKRALRRLSPDDQRLLALRYAAGLDSREIGEQSGMSASGVRSRLARVLDHLRRDLDGD
jgi:RNA polymerase sigma factor (sigma-70 family)